MSEEGAENMKKKTGKKEKIPPIVNIVRYRDKGQLRDAIILLKAAGIQAETDTLAFGKAYGKTITKGAFSLWVRDGDHDRASEVLELACRFARPRKKFQLPPEEGTVEFVDMMVHDCRQYLLIATGELKNISEEGELDLDDPTNDLFKIAIRLKRLKEQCMRQAGLRPLDWQHGGGLGTAE